MCLRCFDVGDALAGPEGLGGTRQARLAHLDVGHLLGGTMHHPGKVWEGRWGHLMGKV